MDLTKIKASLEGKKTYGLCALGIFIFAAAQLHWIQLDPKMLQELQGTITLAAIAALRSAK